jgi:hypothetical protein
MSDLQNPQSQELVRAIVEEVLKRLGHSETQVEGRRTKRSNRKSKRNAIKAQQALISPEQDLWWKSAIREVWKNVHGTTEAKDFASYIPANEAEVELCNEGGGLGPGQDLRLDFGHGYTSSRWNRMILRRIYDEIMAVRAQHGGWGLPDVSEGYIMGELEGQLKRSQEAWAMVQPRISHETGELETPDQLATRIELYTRRRMANVGGRALRQRVSPPPV